MSESEVRLQFKGIDLLSKSLTQRPDNYEGIEFNFDFRMEIKVNQSKELLIPLLNVWIKETNKDAILADFFIACIFHVVDLNLVLTKQENSDFLNIPTHLDLTIKSAAVSTARGIIYSELRGTYLASAIMPLMDIKNFLPDSAKQQLEA